MPIAFITGASSGIGRATAVALAQAGFSLVLTGRREERLQELARELAPTPVHLLVFDVRDQVATAAAIGGLPPEFAAIDVLINNAGNAHGLGPVQEGDLADWDAMLDSNVKGLLYVSRAVLPGMTQRRRGHVINIGSIAGQQAYPNGNVYCASKAAVASLTQSMRLDLLPHGIRVAEVSPGAVETEFAQVRFKGDADRAAAVYQGFEPLRATDVAEVIAFMVTRPPHVNVAEVLLLPAAQASTMHFRRE